MAVYDGSLASGRQLEKGGRGRRGQGSPLRLDDDGLGAVARRGRGKSEQSRLHRCVGVADQGASSTACSSGGVLLLLAVLLLLSSFSFWLLLPLLLALCSGGGWWRMGKGRARVGEGGIQGFYRCVARVWVRREALPRRGRRGWTEAAWGRSRGYVARIARLDAHSARVPSVRKGGQERLANSRRRAAGGDASRQRRRERRRARAVKSFEGRAERAVSSVREMGKRDARAGRQQGRRGRFASLSRSGGARCARTESRAGERHQRFGGERGIVPLSDRRARVGRDRRGHCGRSVRPHGRAGPRVCERAGERMRLRAEVETTVGPGREAGQRVGLRAC